MFNKDNHLRVMLDVLINSGTHVANEYYQIEAKLEQKNKSLWFSYEFSANFNQFLFAHIYEILKKIIVFVNYY